MKKVKCLVLQNNDGKFLKLNENCNTTHPEIVDHPYDAKKIFPDNKEEFENPKPPAYYLGMRYKEDRRRWIEGFKLVLVELEINFKYLGVNK